MAIVIPSKNIYDKQNPKLLKNKIDKIEVNAVNILPLMETQTSVFEKTFYYGVDNVFENAETGLGKNSGTYKGFYGTISSVAGLLEVTPIYLKAKVEIPLLSSNKRINDFYLGKDKNGNPYIQISINAQKSNSWIKTGTIKNAYNQKDQSWNLTGLEDVQVEKLETTISEIKNVSKIDLKTTETVEGYADAQTHYIEINSNITDETNILKEDIFKIENDKAIFDLIVLCGYKEKYLYDKQTHYTTDTKIIDTDFGGHMIVVTPQKVSINIFGDTIGIDLENNIVKIHTNGKENSKNTIRFDSNELIQTTNYYDDTVNEVENSLIKNYNTTLAEYQNGKETAEILCSISNYYDESGKGKISTEETTLPMTFNIGDEVVPMVMNSLGKDIPMSKSKTFEVVGVDFIYDGAVWQKLTLLQK